MECNFCARGFVGCLVSRLEPAAPAGITTCDPLLRYARYRSGHTSFPAPPLKRLNRLLLAAPQDIFRLCQLGYVPYPSVCRFLHGRRRAGLGHSHLLVCNARHSLPPLPDNVSSLLGFASATPSPPKKQRTEPDPEPATATAANGDAQAAAASVPAPARCPLGHGTA